VVRLRLLPIVFLLVIPASSAAEHDWRTVERVVDGDTLLLDGEERVRLIGVDTPEKHPSKKLDRDAERSGRDKAVIQELGERASVFVQELCEGKKVWLEFGEEKKDKYDRTLAYVHLEDGRVLNEVIIVEGYGKAYTVFPFQYMERYLELQKVAREEERGLYAPDVLDSEKAGDDAQGRTVYITPSGKKYHIESCRYMQEGGTGIALEEAKRRGLEPCKVCDP
jgi:micrococcal nuclease